MPTERSADAPAGFDEENPYDSADLESLEPWWRKNVTLFEDHGMRPYRPPRFADGTHTTPVIQRLEAALDVSIRLRVVDPNPKNEWEVVVDDEPVGTVDRYRDDGGFSVYGIDAAAFESLVRTALS